MNPRSEDGGNLPTSTTQNNTVPKMEVNSEEDTDDSAEEFEDDDDMEAAVNPANPASGSGVSDDLAAQLASAGIQDPLWL